MSRNPLLLSLLLTTSLLAEKDAPKPAAEVISAEAEKAQTAKADATKTEAIKADTVKPEAAKTDATDHSIQALLETPVAEEVKKEVEPRIPSKWRLGAGYAPIIGLKANFAGSGNAAPAPAPGPGQNHEYLNGFVRVDASGNAGGDTSFWGYDNAAQASGGNMTFQGLASDVNPSGSTSQSGSAAGSFEIYGLRHIGSFDIHDAGGKRTTWGFRTGFQYARVDISNSANFSGTASTFTDTYNLGGAPLLAPGQYGSFLGPNQLITDTPSSSVLGGSSAVQISGSRSIDVHLAMSQWGTYLQIPVTEKLDVMLEGGFILAVASGSYDYNNRVSLGGGSGQVTRGGRSTTKILPGFYTGVGLTYAINDRFSLQSSARYQYLKAFDITANGSTAQLDFSSAFVLSFGALWRF